MPQALHMVCRFARWPVEPAWKEYYLILPFTGKPVYGQTGKPISHVSILIRSATQPWALRCMFMIGSKRGYGWW
jgi:hypothetical protein